MLTRYNILHPVMDASIKYLLLITLLSGSIFSSAQWSIPDGFESPNGEKVFPSPSNSTVNTPHQTSVPVYILTDDWTSTTKTYLINYWQGQYSNSLIVESEATTKYNCHAYAWAENTGVWMDSPKEENYFSSDDNSYALTSNIATATKVWYGSASDHSAQTTIVTYYFSSK